MKKRNRATRRGGTASSRRISNTCMGVAYINESGERLRGMHIFNVPMGEDRYFEAILRQKAKNVEKVTERYVEDLVEEYP